uniref:Uncharacterized protein n=1 Tax=Poecilia latipinna TaxID=48699 RepID=A0A3B3VNV5_9TELE
MCKSLLKVQCYIKCFTSAQFKGYFSRLIKLLSRNILEHHNLLSKNFQGIIESHSEGSLSFDFNVNRIKTS